jgi:tRNA threonylcarbamoyladenosine biosynthesis protein TsaB
MLLLATDTSGQQGSIALANGNEDGSCEVIEVVPLTGGTFSAQLMPETATLLARNSFSMRDLGAFAVACGPGSFTGLRVGLAAIKGMAEILVKPIASVSLLEVMIAEPGQLTGRVVAALDAGRNEVYGAEHGMTEKAGAPVGRLFTREEFLIWAEGATVITPDHALAEVAQSKGLGTEKIARPRADAIARLGWEKVLAGNTVLPEELEANYIRRSDAEIFSKGRSSC